MRFVLDASVTLAQGAGAEGCGRRCRSGSTCSDRRRAGMRVPIAIKIRW